MNKQIKDLTGQRFGKLTVLRFARTKYGKAYWECKCDCGKTKEIQGTSLTREKATISCGCIREFDLTGQRFGRLIAQKLIYKDSRYSYWLCQCDCGKSKIVKSCSLRKGERKSCGCLYQEEGKGYCAGNYGKTPELRSWYAMLNRCIWVKEGTEK